MQLPLGVSLRDDATLQNYFPAKNLQVWQHVTLTTQMQGERFLYLWGAPGVGCTHLLQGACLEVNNNGQSAFYVSCKQLIDDPNILQGLEQVVLICLDDVQLVAGDKHTEEAVFHFFNRIQEEKRFLLVAGNAPPKQLSITLPDLKSRLGWGVTYYLQSLSDEEKLSALVLRAQARGLEFPQEVGRFIVTRCGRSMSKLYDILDKLDKASLAAQRRLTIPFVKEVLAL